MTLAEGLFSYVARKHKSGYRFDRGENTLRSFVQGFPAGTSIGHVKSAHIMEFLNRRTVAAVTWRHRYWLLFRFFKYWSDHGAMDEIAMPSPRPAVRRSYTPYIFTVGELQSILSANDKFHDFRLAIHAKTFRVVILFLYATGASVGEVRHIQVSDLEVADGFLRIRSTRPNRSRRIPVGPDLLAILEEYIAWRGEKPHVCPYLFTTKKDRQIASGSVSLTFRRVRRLAGIRRFDGSVYQPRVDDLRYTFAVHRITKWIEDGVDLNRMLPALAAYLGQVGLGSTERYLFLTPERFRRDLERLSPSRGRGNWYKDSELMNFLASLQIL